MGARAVTHYVTKMIKLLRTIKKEGVFSNQIKNLFKQLSIGDHFSSSKIKKPLVYPISVCSPTVFVDQETGISAPSLVTPAEPVEHPKPAQIQRGNRECILKPGTDIGNTHFEGWKATTRTYVPPEHAGIFNNSNPSEDFNMPQVLLVTVEVFGKPGTGHLIPDRYPIGH